jgi:hypothetical protein
MLRSINIERSLLLFSFGISIAVIILIYANIATAEQLSIDTIVQRAHDLADYVSRYDVNKKRLASISNDLVKFNAELNKIDGSLVTNPGDTAKLLEKESVTALISQKENDKITIESLVAFSCPLINSLLEDATQKTYRQTLSKAHGTPAFSSVVGDLGPALNTLKKEDWCGLKTTAESIINDIAQFTDNYWINKNQFQWLRLTIEDAQLADKSQESLSTLNDIVIAIADVVTGLTTVGINSITFGLTIGMGSQVFKESQQEWESFGLLKGLGFSLSAIAIPVATIPGDDTQKGNNTRPWVGGISAVAGLVVGIAGYILDGKKVPESVGKIADRLGGNRMIGLAVQEMNTEFQEVKTEFTSKTQPQRPNNFTYTPNNSLSDKAWNLLCSLIAKDSKWGLSQIEQTECNKRPAKQDYVTINSTDLDALQATYTGWVTYINNSQNSYREWRVKTTEYLAATQVVVDSFAKLVSTLKTLANRLRQLLGNIPDDKGYCAPNTSYPDFCSLPNAANRGMQYFAADMLTAEGTKELMEIGQSVLTIYNESKSALDNANSTLESVKSKIDTLNAQIDYTIGVQMHKTEADISRIISP